MTKPRPDKKPAPAPRRVLPMELRIGDRLVDETGEWEVIGPLYRSPGGKNAGARVRRVGRHDVTKIQAWLAPVWRLMRRLRIFLCIAFVAAGIVTATWAWRLLSPSSVTDKIALLNLFAVVATAVVVAWYSWETRKLRQVAHRQSALQIRPFLGIEYGEARKIWVQNLGKGVARDIRCQNVPLVEIDAAVRAAPE